MTDFSSRHKISHQDGGGDEISVAGLSGVLADEQDAGEIKGVEVDDTDIAADKVLAYNASTEKLEYETPASGGDAYVDRGDPASHDWTKTTLTADGLWHDLDCSTIVPSGAKVIVFNISLYDDTTNGYLYMRKKGNSNNKNMSNASQNISNEHAYAQVIVACDSDRKVEYRLASKTWGLIYLTIAGWII